MILVGYSASLLKKETFSIPLNGTINLHASLLPDYRGSAPINWVIMNNEKITGVTTFFIDDKIDTGDILIQEKIKIELEFYRIRPFILEGTGRLCAHVLLYVPSPSDVVTSPDYGRLPKTENQKP